MKNKDYIWFGIIIVCVVVTIFAISKFDNCQVTFAKDGEIYKTIEIPKDTAIGEYDIPTKDGYQFIGWFDENGNILDSSTIIKANMIYYARWAEIVTSE